jgi:RNA polymerase sigma-70 factor (ECF subfamily)
MEEKRPSEQQYIRQQAPPARDEAVALPDETELLQRSSRGDSSAQHELVERHSRYLFGVAHALSGDAHDAEDLVQETFLGAFRTKFRGESSLRTWLVKILMRRAGMLRRWHGRQPKIETFDESREQTPVEQPGKNQGSSADAKMDLTKMLEALSPEHRQVIILRELQGLSYEEMAEALGVPRGTVESRLHRAREELRKRFKGYL